MSIVNIDACYDLRAALEYQAGDNNERIAVCSSNIEPLNFDNYAQMQIESGSHKVQGYTVIQSFSLDELQNTQNNAELVNKLGCALIEAAYPNYPYNVITHRDSETGHIHNHCSVLNYEFETGKAITQNRRWLDLSRINDSVMEKYGMEVCDAKTRQADQKQYWDKKRNPDKYIWQDDLENRIHKSINGAVSVKDFAARLAVEGVTTRIFAKDGKPLKHMSFSFIGNDGKIHKKRGSKMKIISEPKELAAVFAENAAKKQLKQQPSVVVAQNTSLIFAKEPTQGLIKQAREDKATEAAEIAKQKAKAEAEEKERRKAEQIHLSQQKERERIQRREKLKQQLLTDSKTYNELENYDDLSANEQDRLDDEERKRQIRLQEIYAEEAIEKADARRASAQLDKKLEYAYNVSKQKQRTDDGYSL